MGEPIDGQITLLTAAKSSVPPSQLPDLIERAQRHLEPELETYRRTAECVFEDDDRAVFLLEAGFWRRVGAEVGFDDREWKAVRRAHTDQFRRVGRRTDRDEEFEVALEIREPVCIGL